MHHPEEIEQSIVTLIKYTWDIKTYSAWKLVILHIFGFSIITRLETLESSGAQKTSKEHPRNSRISHGTLNDL